MVHIAARADLPNGIATTKLLSLLDLSGSDDGNGNDNGSINDNFPVIAILDFAHKALNECSRTQMLSLRSITEKSIPRKPSSESNPFSEPKK